MRSKEGSHTQGNFELQLFPTRERIVCGCIIVTFRFTIILAYNLVNQLLLSLKSLPYLYIRTRLIDRSICFGNEFELTTSFDFSAMARAAQREISRQKKVRHLSQFLIFVQASRFR